MCGEIGGFNIVWYSNVAYTFFGRQHISSSTPLVLCVGISISSSKPTKQTKNTSLMSVFLAPLTSVVLFSNTCQPTTFLCETWNVTFFRRFILFSGMWLILLGFQGCIKKGLSSNLILLWSNLNTNFDSARPPWNLFYFCTLSWTTCSMLPDVHSFWRFQVLPLFVRETSLHLWCIQPVATSEPESSLMSLEFLISPVEDTQLL